MTNICGPIVKIILTVKVFGPTDNNNKIKISKTENQDKMVKKVTTVAVATEIEIIIIEKIIETEIIIIPIIITIIKI